MNGQFYFLIYFVFKKKYSYIFCMICECIILFCYLLFHYRAFQKMERCFSQFSPTCTGAKRERLVKTRATLLGLMEPGICDDFVDTEVPLCPDIPKEDRKCDLFSAFSCLLEYNTDLMSSPSVVFMDKCM